MHFLIEIDFEFFLPTESDIIMILNNHRLNARSALYYKGTDFKLIFDGWNQLNSEEIESLHGLTYSTIGYISKF